VVEGGGGQRKNLCNESKEEVSHLQRKGKVLVDGRGGLLELLNEEGTWSGRVRGRGGGWGKNQKPRTLGLGKELFVGTWGRIHQVKGGGAGQKEKSEKKSTDLAVKGSAKKFKVKWGGKKKGWNTRVRMPRWKKRRLKNQPART